MMGRDEWVVYQGQMVDGKYHLQELLGDPGGSGAVFQANEVVADQVMGRPVALKLIPVGESEIDKQKQLRELRATATLKHENILDHYARGSCRLCGRDFLYIAMEVADETLRQRLRKGSLSDFEALELARQIASALDYLHSQAETWVHRDIKPANIMRVGSRWKLADFGLIRSTGKRSADLTGNLVGTEGYAPPEAYDGEISSAWDVWSLGVLVLESLTGKNPFKGATLEQTMRAVLTQQPAIPQELPEPLLSVIKGCLAKDRRARLMTRSLLNMLALPVSQPTAQSVGLVATNNQMTVPSQRPRSFQAGTAGPLSNRILNVEANRSSRQPATVWSSRIVTSNQAEPMNASGRALQRLAKQYGTGLGWGLGLTQSILAWLAVSALFACCPWCRSQMQSGQLPGWASVFSMMGVPAYCWSNTSYLVARLADSSTERRGVLYATVMIALPIVCTVCIILNAVFFDNVVLFCICCLGWLCGAIWALAEGLNSMLNSTS
jgi:serine/threonine protein kinase